MANFSLSTFSILFALFTFTFGSVIHNQQRQTQNQLSSTTTALATTTTSDVSNLRNILIPAIQSLIGVPLRLFRQLLLDFGNFIRSHNFHDYYDISFIQQIMEHLPTRVFTYWNTLMIMEQQCMQRTICDLADYASSRMPKWTEQIALIYLNAFSSTNSLYQVMIHGLTSHRCSAIYAECNAEQFLTQIRNNVSDTFSTTIRPLQDAFGQLLNVTTSTISSLMIENGNGFKAANSNFNVPINVLPQSSSTQQFAANNRLINFNDNNGGGDDVDDENETNDEDERRNFNLNRISQQNHFVPSNNFIENPPFQRQRLP